MQYYHPNSRLLLIISFLCGLIFYSPAPAEAADIAITDTLCITTKDTINIQVNDGSLFPSTGLDLSTLTILHRSRLMDIQVNSTTGIITLMPSPYRTGTEVVQFKICTITGDCYITTITLFIDPWNTVSPISDDIITFMNTPVDHNVYFNDFDAENDPFYMMNGGLMIEDMIGTVTNEDSLGNFTYVPKTDFTGKDRLEYIISDTKTPPTIRNAYINARVIKRNPSCSESVIAIADEYSAPINGAINGNVLWNDKDILSVTPLRVNVNPIQPPLLGTITLDTNGNFTYTPARNSIYLESIQYEVCNTDSTCRSCDTTWLYIRCGMDRVAPCQDVPKHTQDGFNAGCNDHLMEGELIDSHTAPHPYYVNDSVLLAPQHGTVIWDSTGHYIYTPDAGYSGPDRFGYQICKFDPSTGTKGACTKASTLVMIFNQTPIIAADDYASVNASTAKTILPVANDFDQEFEIDYNSFQIITQPVHGTVTLQPGAEVTYTPEAHYAGVDSLTYSICDQAHLCAAATCDTATIYYDIAAPMAITFISFDAYLQEDFTVQLDWEAPISGTLGIFNIMRSWDGMKWSNIGAMNAILGQQSYHFTDLLSESKTHPRAYYRIKYTGPDEQQWSTIREVALDGSNSGAYYLYPNPVKEHLFIRLDDAQEMTEIDFYNTDGGLVHRITVGTDKKEWSIDVRDWTPGLYFYEFKEGGNTVKSGKLLKL